MVFCTYCGHSFTRDEHLERHILTHTNVKPFKCFSCHMSFARRDLLQRHYLVHGKDQNNNDIVPSGNGIIPKSAGRTPIACSNCAKTKTKCDRKYPCSRCEARGLTCTLRPTRRATKSVVRTSGAGIAAGVGSTDLETKTEDETEGQDTGASFEPSSSPEGAQQESDGEIPMTSSFALRPAADLSTMSSAPVRPAIVPTPLASPAQFTQHTPMSHFDNLSNMVAEHDADPDTSSPHFLLDWNQMQVPLGFDGMAQQQMLLNPDGSGFDVDSSVLPMAPSADGMLSILPELRNGLTPPLITPPMEMPRPNQDFGYQTEFMHRPKLRQSQSSFDGGDVRGEMAAIVRARDAWSYFRCVPTIPSTACPRTARLNLERLEQTLKNHDGWSTWSPLWDESEFASGDHLTIMQLHESTRDKLLAITQTFLHKALEIHREGSGASLDQADHAMLGSHTSNFILLPPARVLEYFLRSYANCFERFYPLTSRGSLDANELLHCYNDRAASLLVLMMIAQGAMNIPSIEARMLTGGLTEACRISLFDLIEKNIIMAGDQLVLHAALIFTVQAAWSGDKWQMDIAMGQRGMYFAMLRHSGTLEPRGLSTSPTNSGHVNADLLWSQWLLDETRSRLVYSWAMVDQELALFHDTAPLLSVTEFTSPMPDADQLWHARNAVEWSTVFNQVHEFSNGYSSVGSGARPLSLRRLFRHFLNDELALLGIEMTPLQLRLLLHPIQSLVSQCSELLVCFSDAATKQPPAPRVLTSASTHARLEELQGLLRRWYHFAERHLKAHHMCAMMHTNMLFFHLISLNAATEFPRIESMARGEKNDLTPPQMRWQHTRCIFHPEEAIFHCGQVLRLVRAMPRSTRPPWWTGAVYRVGLVMWSYAQTKVDEASAASSSSANIVGTPRGVSGAFAIDTLLADHPAIIRYLTKREGVPCLTRRDGSQILLTSPSQILQHCIEVIDEGAPTRFSDGIRAKLERLAAI